MEDDDLCREPHFHPESLAIDLDDQALSRAAAMFKALSDVSRLKILWALAKRPCCVSELASLSQDEISTVSQRLRILRADRLVVRRREGKHAIYSVNDHHVVEMIENAVAHAQEP